MKWHKTSKPQVPSYIILNMKDGRSIIGMYKYGDLYTKNTLRKIKFDWDDVVEWRYCNQEDIDV